tara:strand:- start:210 stop:800 length:591 start_codon:yes stop_codon:yes gene_type:complete
MAIAINGSTNVITGIGVGGLPDGIVDTDMLAANAVSSAKLASGAGGKILQVVQKKLDVSGANWFSTTSTSFVEVTGLAQTLTLASSSNKVLIEVDLHTVVYGASYMRARSQVRFGDFATADGLSTNLVGVYNVTGGAGAEYVYVPHTHRVLHTPATASPTYRIAVRLIENSQTLYVFADGNVDGLESSVTFMEVAA